MSSLGLVLPLYRAESYLPRLLTDVKECAPFLSEVVVVEDGVSSLSPNVESFVSELEAVGLNVRSAFHDRADPNVTYNLGLTMLNTDYAWILDQDDSPSPGICDHFHTAIQGTSETVVLAAGLRVENRQLRLLSSLARVVIVVIHWRRRTMSGRAIRIGRKVPVIGLLSTRSSLVYPQSAILANPFPVPFYDGSDIVHLQKIRSSVGLVFLPKCFVTYRMHNTAATRRAKSRDRAVRAHKLKDLPRTIRMEHAVRSFIAQRIRG